MHQKLRRPGSVRTRWELTALPSRRPPIAVLRAGEGTAAQKGSGREAGRVKGGWGGEGRKKERKESGVVPHPKLNPGCATGPPSLCSKCPWVETDAGWSHLIWRNFVTVRVN